MTNSTRKDSLYSADFALWQSEWLLAESNENSSWSGNASDDEDGAAATAAGEGGQEGDDEIPPLRLLLSAFMFVVVIISFLANLFVVLSFVVEKKLRTTFTALIANLALTDLLVAVVAMDFYTIDVMYGHWPFGRVLCGIWVVCDYSTVFASCFTLAAISIDRLWSIKWAINYRQHNNMKKSITIITGIWITVVGIVWYPIISDRVLRTRDAVCKYVPAENPQFVIALAILGHHTPCTLIVVCYFIVYREMRKLLRVRPTARHTHVPPANHRQVSVVDANSSSITETGGDDKTSSSSNRTTVASDGQKQQQTREERERKTFVTLSYIVLCYIVCWVPFHIVYDLSIIAPQIVPENLFTYTFWLTYVNSTLNPFLYAFSSNDLRNAVKDLIRCRIRH